MDVYMYAMWYIGELTKLCAYSLWLRLLVRKGKVRLDRSASTHVSALCDFRIVL